MLAESRHKLMGALIIDNTLLEIIKFNSSISSREIMQAASYLIEMGADMLGVNHQLEKLLSGVSGSIKLINIKEAFLEVEFDDISERNLKSAKKCLSDKQCKALMLKGLYKCLPWKMDQYMNQIKSNIHIPVALCIYDTTNMATAIAVEAAKAGADCIITCFSGKGKYRNYSALEEVVMALNYIYQEHKNMNMKNVQKMVKLHEGITWTEISGRKPILGKDIFKCESGIHGDGILKNRRTYEPYPAETVGQETQLILGKHSGKSMVLEKLRRLNIECSDMEASMILERIKIMGYSGIYVDDNILKQMFLSMHDNIPK